jgi:hypothetical protein
MLIEKLIFGFIKFIIGVDRMSDTADACHAVEFDPQGIEFMYKFILLFSILGIDKLIDPMLEAAFETLQLGSMVCVVGEFHFCCLN